MAQDVRINNLQKQTQLASNRIPLWLALNLVPKFGFASYQKLRVGFSNPLDIFRLSASELGEFGFDGDQIAAIQRPDQKKIDRCLKWLDESQSHFICTLEDGDFPALLKETSRPPLLLLGRGNKLALNSAQVAMVGSRSPSFYGKQQADLFSKKLGAVGWTITSGLALGIDGCCHKGALKAKADSIAVLGCGIDNIYPKRHAHLAQELVDNAGLIVSEFLPGTPISPNNFPRRNRIISGLSLATIVVEAAIKSGSLITAKYALEQNREVFAIPGSISNPLAQGCHYLIKQGAALLDQVEDIIDAFHHLNFHQHNQHQKNLQKNVSQPLATGSLLDSVDHEVTALDVVVQRCNKPISEVLAQLLEFELRGLVASVPGGYIKLGEE